MAHYKRGQYQEIYGGPVGKSFTGHKHPRETKFIDSDDVKQDIFYFSFQWTHYVPSESNQIP